LPWAETGRPKMKTGEPPRSITLPAAVVVGERWREGGRWVKEVAGDAGRPIWRTGRRGAHQSRLPVALHGQVASSTAAVRPRGRRRRPAGQETPRCTHRARGGDGGGRRPRQRTVANDGWRRGGTEGLRWRRACGCFGPPCGGRLARAGLYTGRRNAQGRQLTDAGGRISSATARTGSILSRRARDRRAPPPQPIRAWHVAIERLTRGPHVAQIFQIRIIPKNRIPHEKK
jgi:hypothetical protein